MNTLGERLSAVRQQRGLTQAEVARRAHLPQQAISRLERGDRSHVRSDVLARLALALDVSTDVPLGLRDLAADADTTRPQRKRQRACQAAPVV
jgi:transcriptional regulator with XRE-family HTH domain